MTQISRRRERPPAQSLKRTDRIDSSSSFGETSELQRAAGNLYAREWYFALNNRGDRHSHSDYEFLRDRGHPFFFASLLSDAFQGTTGNCARLFTLWAKSLSSADGARARPRAKKPGAQRRTRALVRCDDRDVAGLWEIIEIPVDDVGE